MSAPRIMVSGSRTWTDRDAIESVLLNWWERETQSNPRATLMSGACPAGADAIAEKVWHDVVGGPIERWPAAWKVYGKRAGFIRTRQMLYMRPDFVALFIKDGSPGSTHAKNLTLLLGLPYTLVEIGEIK